MIAKILENKENVFHLNTFDHVVNKNTVAQ